MNDQLFKSFNVHKPSTKLGLGKKQKGQKKKLDKKTSCFKNIPLA